MTFTLPPKVRQVLYVVLAVAGLAVPYAESRGWITASQWQSVLAYASTLGFTLAASKTSTAATAAPVDVNAVPDVGPFDNADPTLSDEDDVEEPVTAEAV